MELKTTFGDLDGRGLFFPEGCSSRSSKRLLALHGHAAFLYVRVRYPLPETADFYLDQDMSVSDDAQTQEALQYLPLQ